MFDTTAKQEYWARCLDCATLMAFWSFTLSRLPALQLVAPTILPWGNIELGGLKLPPDAVACGWALTIRDPFTPQSTPPHQRREHQK
jgi:hypothetical protein